MFELALVGLPLDKGARGIQKKNFPPPKNTYQTPKTTCYLFFFFSFFNLKPLNSISFQRQILKNG